MGEAATHTVTNCNDSGAGSLRATIGAASTVSGDIVNFNSPLGCSTITLSSGEIVIAQDNLTINGPGMQALEISGGSASRVLLHSGFGTLAVSDLTIAYGFLQSSVIASGGCVVSNGNVVLDRTAVTSCLALGQGNASAYGGGIFTGHDLTLRNSRLAYNLAVVPANQTHFTDALGGGAYVSGNLQSSYSSIMNNSASTPTHNGRGGGLNTNGSAVVDHTTIAKNHADGSGGWRAVSVSPGPTVQISDSTISGNTAIGIAAMECEIPLTIANSTIAFNEAEYDFGGLYVSATTTLSSSIVADNIVQYPIQPSSPGDVNGFPATRVISGSHNLVTSSPLTLPPDTLTACPKLGPLADNGGSTKTHALLHNSPAIDHGNSEIFPPNDQRGSGFPRFSGNSVDIGAFEWQGAKDDRLFVSRFESGCDD